MWESIFDYSTKSFVSIHSKRGLHLLRKYIIAASHIHQHAGDPSPNETAPAAKHFLTVCHSRRNEIIRI